MGHQHGYLAEGHESIYRMEFAMDCNDDFFASKAIYVMMRDECKEEDVKLLQDSFEKLCHRLNLNLKHDNAKYMAGDKMTVADFHLFHVFSVLVDNACVKHQKINDAAKEILGKHEELMKWNTLMHEENKDYLESRHMAPFWEVKFLVKSHLK